MSGRSPEELQRALEKALDARDLALSQLADARAELNSLRLRCAHPNEPPPGAWPAAGSEALPLRYRVADQLNHGVRTLTGSGHTILKRLLSKR